MTINQLCVHVLYLSLYKWYSHDGSGLGPIYCTECNGAGVLVYNGIVLTCPPEGQKKHEVSFYDTVMMCCVVRQSGVREQSK